MSAGSSCRIYVDGRLVRIIMPKGGLSLHGPCGPCLRMINGESCGLHLMFGLRLTLPV